MTSEPTNVPVVKIVYSEGKPTSGVTPTDKAPVAPQITPGTQAVINKITKGVGKAAAVNKPSNQAPLSRKTYSPPNFDPVQEQKLQTAEHLGASAIYDLAKTEQPLPYGDPAAVANALGSAAVQLTASAFIDDVVMRVARQEYKASIKMVNLADKSVTTFPYIIIYGIQKRLVQRYQLTSTFDDNLLYLFGEQPVSVTFTCGAYDLVNHNWYRSLENLYTTTANAFTAAKNKMITYVAVDNWLFEGAWVELSPQHNAMEPGIVRCGMTLILTGVQDLGGSFMPNQIKTRDLMESENMNLAAARAYAASAAAVSAAAGSMVPGDIMTSMYSSVASVTPEVLSTAEGEAILKNAGARDMLTQPSAGNLQSLVTPADPKGVPNAFAREQMDKVKMGYRGAVGGSVMDKYLQKNTGVAAIPNQTIEQAVSPTNNNPKIRDDVSASSVAKNPKTTSAVYAAAIPSGGIKISKPEATRAGIPTNFQI